MGALTDELDGYVKSNPHRVTGKFDGQARTFRLRAEVLKKPDTEQWGVILGDLVHNLRCALDHLIWQLVLLNNEKPGRHLQFPTVKSGAGYWSRGRDGQPSTRETLLRGVSDKHKALIDSLQPYRGAHTEGAHPLAILQSLSNVDKHRFLHGTAFGYDPADSESFKLLGNQDAGGIESVEFEPFPDEGEAEVMRVVFACPGPNPEVQMEGELPVYIAFGDPPIRLQDIHTVIVAVGNVLKTFEPDFPS